MVLGREGGGGGGGGGEILATYLYNYYIALKIIS